MNENRQFDLVVFDWDGTLMDSTATIVQCIQASARDLGLPIPSDADAAHVIGLSLLKAMETVLPHIEPHYYPKMVERYRVHYLSQEYDIQLFKGVEAMLADLRQQHYFLAVATGKSRVGLNRALEKSGLGIYFDATRCADETFSKPHPLMLYQILKELGQDESRTLMVGDTSHDLQMAANAQVQGVGVAFGAHPVAHLKDYQPLYIASSVPELHQWIVNN